MNLNPILPEQNSQLFAINQIAQKVHTSLSVDEVIQITLYEFSSVHGFDLVLFFLRRDNELKLVACSPEDLPILDNHSQCSENCLCKLAYESGETVFSEDISTDPRCATMDLVQAGIRSMIAIPLQKLDETLGILCLGSDQNFDYNHQKVFLESMVSQVSIAISNALLYENARQQISEGIKVTGQLSTYRFQLEELVRRRTEELRQNYKELQNEVAERKKAEIAERAHRKFADALEKSAAILNSTLNLEEVLDSILVTLEDVIPHESANIMLINHKEMVAFVVRYKGNPKIDPLQKPPTSLFPILSTPTLNLMYETHEPFMIPDVNVNSIWIDQIGSDWIRSYLAAPILYGNDVLGFLNLVSDTPGFYEAESLSRIQAFANHASIAIRNARLYDQAGEVAVLEERQKLSRDMHDAVSQTLFIANVIAEALPEQFERDPANAKEGLERLRTLVRGALSEIRTLLVELRPEALYNSDLGELISQIAYGALSYSQFEVTIKTSGNYTLPEDVQVVFFRIAQEIFNNIIKHANASKVRLEFLNNGDRLLLKVVDNGRGFETNLVKPDRMGLTIMRERAISIGAQIKISSSVGVGTAIILEWEQP